MSITKQLLLDVSRILDEDRDVQDSKLRILTEDRMDILSAIKTSVARLGLVAVVALKSREPGQGNEEVWSLDIVVTENVVFNRGPSGSKLTSIEACDLVVATLSGVAPGEEWSALRFVGQGEPTEDSGLLLRTITFRTSTYPQPTDL